MSATAVVWQGSTAWLGPTPVAASSASAGRVWRWSTEEASAPAYGGAGSHPADGGPLGFGLTQPPGFAEPGLGLLDAAGAPVVALGRHPRHHGRPGRTEAWVEQAVLVPAGDGWRPLLTVHDGWESIEVRTAAGAEVTRITRRTATGSWRASGLAPRDRFTVDGRTWQPREVRAAGRWGRRSSAAGVVGIDIVDPSDDSVRASLVAEGVRGLGDDITLPFTVRWFGAPTLVEQGVVLALLGITIDADHSVHLG